MISSSEGFAGSDVEFGRDSGEIAVCTDKSVPLGKYWRSSPLMFSFDPRCHGELS